MLSVLPRVGRSSLRRQLHTSRVCCYAVEVQSNPAVSGPRGKDGKEKLVILGSGWGAMSLLKSLDKKKYDLSVVSPNTYFAMTPLLAQAATGTLELRATMEPVRGNQYTQFYHAWVESIDLKNNKLLLMPAYPPAFRQADPLRGEDVQDSTSKDGKAGFYPNARGGHSNVGARAPHRRAIETNNLEDLVSESDKDGDLKEEGHHSYLQGEKWTDMEKGREYEMTFDKLVISVGAYNRTFSTPGVRENAWFLKDVQNARAIRWRILECFEQADHPDLTDEQRRRILNFLVVGGGPTGSEFAAELHDLCNSDLKRLYPDIIHLSKISIIDASGGILNTFDASLATYAREKFKRDGIDLLLNRKVKEVQRGNLIVEPDGDIPFGLLVWSTGICASPLVKGMTCFAKDDKNSHFLTDDRLRVFLPGTSPADADQELTPVPNVFAIGDCAQIKGKPLPATAQVASQMGKHLAFVLNGQMSDDDASGETIFKHKDMGSMASLGGGSAIVDGPKAKAQGRIAWLIWRSAYTFMSMSWRNRLLVPGFWAINKIFGRDLTRF